MEQQAGDSKRLPIVLAITGASGAIYGLRLLQVLVHRGRDVELLISPAGRDVIAYELGLQVDLSRFSPEMLGPWVATAEIPAPWGLAASEQARPGQLPESGHEERRKGTIRFWHQEAFEAPVASGSFPTGGMVICPCSLNTLASVVHGLGDNLIRRAAVVHLKEQRPLVVVPRETPLSALQLRNMYLAARHGVIILPAMPAFYHRPTNIGMLVDFVVARICDHLKVEHNLVRPWPNS